jgi:uncharacterized protein (DUF779 family)
MGDLRITPEATQMAERLVHQHGPLALFQSGGCCDGTTPICLLADDMPAGTHDLCLGEVAGIPFYIDAEQYRRWGEPAFVLDVGPGAPEGFSLGLRDAHFVSRSPRPVAANCGHGARRFPDGDDRIA